MFELPGDVEFRGMDEFFMEWEGYDYEDDFDWEEDQNGSYLDPEMLEGMEGIEGLEDINWEEFLL